MEQNKQVDEDSLFPQSFFCPLTLQVMKDPVMDSEGNSYERTAIEEWLKKNSTSPVTRNPLKESDLIPNRALRNAIEEKLVEVGKTPEGVKTVQAVTPEDNNLQTESVKLSISATKEWVDPDSTLVMVSLKPPVGKQATPVDICCVVDISGSMGEEAKMKGNSEAQGLSLLDIVKHAVKTIINVLTAQDRLSLVVYSTRASVVFDLIPMNDAGKARAMKEVEKLTPDDQTNLWDGLYTGLEVIRESRGPAKSKLCSVLLLTDGQPNVIPPRGHIPMLKKYKDDHPNMQACTINTFGFGYKLDTQLLNDIAVEGGGMYVFIPDSGFVGTAFVNATSNLLATMSNVVSLSLEPLNGSSIVEPNETDPSSGGVLGGYLTNYTSWGATVNLCSLQYDQTKNVVIKMKGISDKQDKPFLRATLKYVKRTSNNKQEEVDESIEGGSWDDPLEIEAQRHRLVAVDTIRKAIVIRKKESSMNALKPVNELVAQIKGSKTGKSDKRVQALVEDLNGQVLEALDSGYSKWGVHYLPSLKNAHLLQMCNNFKDPGVQVYGGKLFEQLRDKADAVFIKLPPPKPAVRSTPSWISSSSSSSSSSSASNPKPVSSMRVYHSRGNPCFHGNCLVKMVDGSQKMVKQVEKGDKVMSHNNKPSEVVCVVRTVCDKQVDLVALPGGLIVTPYHPVKIDLDSSWKFPCHISPARRDIDCDAVYSFVLKDNHTMLINGITCVTLGHNFNDNDVVSHAYFGSQLVINDLKNMRGWKSGIIQLNQECDIRNPITGQICGLKQTI